MLMAIKSISSELNAQIAEVVFGWKNVHQHDGELIGKKPDKLGRMRNAKVPDYAGDASQAYAIDERMKQLGKESAYLKELARISRTKDLPPEWATPEQRGRAAVAVLGGRRRKK